MADREFPRSCTRRHTLLTGAALTGTLALPPLGNADSARIEEGYIEGGDVRLFYRSAGEGPLMIFLHGVPDDGTLYIHQLCEFSRDHLVVAPNLRGVPPSDQPDDVDAYRMPHLLDDIHRMIDHFGRERCILVGNDWGGWFAWVFASAYPERVDRLVIMNVAHPAIYLRDVMHNPAQIAASQYERDAVKAEPVGPAAWTHYVQADPIRVPASIEEATTMAKPDLAAHYFTGLDHRPPATRDLTIERPTLVIWGMRDSPMLPSLLVGLDDYVKDLTIHRMNDAGHLPMLQKPDEVNRVMRQFLDNGRSTER